MAVGAVDLMFHYTAKIVVADCAPLTEAGYSSKQKASSFQRTGNLDILWLTTFRMRSRLR